MKVTFSRVGGARRAVVYLAFTLTLPQDREIFQTRHR